ncbi:MAG: AAA family ATPase [Planctomycetaceae bacterium]
MEAIIFIGLQASGKSSFYRERFFSSHVRISLDLLRTRYREHRMLSLCLETRQPFVIDNTNPTREDRRRYIAAAHSAGFSIIGYYFSGHIAECVLRNHQRSQPIPTVGLLATARRLQIPLMDEGFLSLKYVRLKASGFVIEDWRTLANESEKDI